jgi:heme a synthase
MTLTQAEQKNNKIIAKWIFCGVAMIVIQVLIGGITRLTGSGLSITEWKPIMGFMPPLNETEWQVAFDKYKSIAQYKYINNHFTLANFKYIFFWEWFHRVWARVLLGLAFALPFCYFYFKKMITPSMYKPLLTLVLLGALEGLFGWIMVRSGLNDENVYVNHINLSIHFITAMFISCYAMVFGLSLITQPQEKLIHPALKKVTFIILMLLFVQLVYGAFMAGLKAANVAPTWPLINGMIIPNVANGIADFLFFNKITIHFIHRSLAYILLLVVIIWWLKAKKTSVASVFYKAKNIPLFLVFLQVLLGIASVLFSVQIVMGSFGVFEWMALLHQLTGMALLLSLVSCWYLLSYK